MGRPTKDTYYLDIALSVSKRSTCNKRHYGCVIVKDDVIVSSGYNGSPRGEINCCEVGECFRKSAERGHDYEECPSVHAEMNAVVMANRESLNGATLYLACEERISGYDLEDSMKEWTEDESPIPCYLCSGVLKNARIARVVNRTGDVFI